MLEKRRVKIYGQVELVFTELYPIGYSFRIGDHEFLEVVEEVSAADGLVVLALTERAEHRYPSCISFLFTHYAVNPQVPGGIDVVATRAFKPNLTRCNQINETLRHELSERSVTASLCMRPSIRFFD